jgi:hypothetical protein
VTQVYALLGHSGLLQMIKPDMLMVLVDPGLTGMQTFPQEDAV